MFVSHDDCSLPPLLFTLSPSMSSVPSLSVFSLSLSCLLPPSFYPLSDTLVAVLERDTLGVREVRLFVAAVRWSEAEAHRQQLQPTPENKRRVLAKALALIRFPLMTIEEFAAGSAHTNTHTHSDSQSFLHTVCLSHDLSLPHSDMSSYPCCVSTQDRPSPVS